MVNVNVKQNVIEMIKKLPDEVGYDDVNAEYIGNTFVIERTFINAFSIYFIGLR